MSLPDLDWDYPDPHIIEHTASNDEADGYGHINNSVFVQWLDQCVWDHCDAVEMTPGRGTRPGATCRLIARQSVVIFKAFRQR